VSTDDANGVFHTESQGFIRTQNGEVATWENRVVGTLIQEGIVNHAELNSEVPFNWRTFIFQ
jgi:hypothetical protein